MGKGRVIVRTEPIVSEQSEGQDWTERSEREGGSEWKVQERTYRPVLTVYPPVLYHSTHPPLIPTTTVDPQSTYNRTALIINSGSTVVWI